MIIKTPTASIFKTGILKESDPRQFDTIIKGKIDDNKTLYCQHCGKSRIIFVKTSDGKCVCPECKKIIEKSLIPEKRIAKTTQTKKQGKYEDFSIPKLNDNFPDFNKKSDEEKRNIIKANKTLKSKRLKKCSQCKEYKEDVCYWQSMKISICSDCQNRIIEKINEFCEKIYA